MENGKSPLKVPRELRYLIFRFVSFLFIYPRWKSKLACKLASTCPKCNLNQKYNNVILQDIEIKRMFTEKKIQILNSTI